MYNLRNKWVYHVLIDLPLPWTGTVSSRLTSRQRQRFHKRTGTRRGSVTVTCVPSRPRDECGRSGVFLGTGEFGVWEQCVVSSSPPSENTRAKDTSDTDSHPRPETQSPRRRRSDPGGTICSLPIPTVCTNVFTTITLQVQTRNSMSPPKTREKGTQRVHRRRRHTQRTPTEEGQSETTEEPETVGLSDPFDRLVHTGTGTGTTTETRRGRVLKYTERALKICLYKENDRMKQVSPIMNCIMFSREHWFKFSF